MSSMLSACQCGICCELLVCVTSLITERHWRRLVAIHDLDIVAKLPTIIVAVHVRLQDDYEMPGDTMSGLMLHVLWLYDYRMITR